MIRKVLLYGSLSIIGLLACISLFVFNVQEPILPETKLNTINVNEFRNTAKVLLADSVNEPARINLSPQQVSFLARHNRPEFRRYGFVLRDIHFQQNGNLGQILATLKGPFGLWIKLDWIGIIKLDQRDTWTVTSKSIWAGQFPMHWFIPEKWSPEWPTTFRKGRIKLHKAQLDDRGLRASLTHNGLKIEIPGVDIEQGLLEEGMETLKDLF